VLTTYTCTVSTIKSDNNNDDGLCQYRSSRGLRRLAIEYELCSGPVYHVHDAGVCLSRVCDYLRMERRLWEKRQRSRHLVQTLSSFPVSKAKDAQEERWTGLLYRHFMGVSIDETASHATSVALSSSTRPLPACRVRGNF
jgi:hypothetical protein